MGWVKESFVDAEAAWMFGYGLFNENDANPILVDLKYRMPMSKSRRNGKRVRLEADFGEFIDTRISCYTRSR